MAQKTIVSVEKMLIPTYPIMDTEKLPMFNENRNHQGTTGNPYPVMPVLSVQRTNCQDKEYEVVRMENDYIRLILIPSLGGRVFEAYDKVNDYHFLYRQHVIKPALIGAYGLWISGGLEFNWPFHHRPSTFMPVNFSVETEADGTGICYLSECDPTDRTRSTVGIVLHPDAAFFETRVQVSNRTPLKHSFLSWQNGAVRVNQDYQFIFPPDVSHVTHHHHTLRAPLTYPVAQGPYGGITYEEPTDISWYKNNLSATSHFAAPSKYDFFGGYDHGKRCGVIHYANHHTSPGKKMFTWGCGALGQSWEKALTDEDGPYCELMASSFSNNQPDFTWLEPYETKRYSEFWYPVGALGKTSFATLDAAVCVDLEGGALRVQTTRAQKGLRVTLIVDGRAVLEGACDTVPGTPAALAFDPTEGRYAVTVSDESGKVLLDYAERENDELHFPEAIELYPHPDTIRSPQGLYLQGLHLDQYRDAMNAPEVYYEEALRRDPEHLPSLIALGECKYRSARFAEAKALLEKAVEIEHTYNLHYPDGEAEYLLALTLDALGEEGAALDLFWNASWSGRSVPMAMSKAAALEGRRGDYAVMLSTAQTAVEAAARHPLANAYRALAQWKLGKPEAKETIENALALDPRNELLLAAKLFIDGAPMRGLWTTMRSDHSQTALDVAFDLADAGLYAEAKAVLISVEAPSTPMVGYALSWIQKKLGEDPTAALTNARATDPKNRFPYRLYELKALEEAVQSDPTDDRAIDLLACILYDRRHYARAAALWEKARALKPEKALYARNLAVAYFSHLNRRDEALSLLKEAIVLSPDDDQLKLEYLYAANKAGTPGEERLQEIKAHPAKKERDDYTLEKARAYLVANRWDEAERAMLAHEFVPAEGGERAITGLYYLLGIRKARVLMNEGRAREAHDVLRGIIEALPENLHAGNWVDSELAPVFYYDAVALDALGDVKARDDCYEEVLRRTRQSPPEHACYRAAALRALGEPIQARVFLSRAVRALEERQSQRAIGWQDTVAMFNSYMNDPADQRQGNIDYCRGMLALFEGKKDEAKALFEESRRLWPENMNAWLELSLL